MRCDMQHMFLFTMRNLIEQLDIGRLDELRRRCFEVIQENIGTTSRSQKFLFSRRVFRGYLTRGI